MSKQTTQADLLRLAEQYRGTTAVESLLIAIMESQMQARLGMDQAKAAMNVAENALSGVEGFSVALDQAHMVTAAHKAAAAMSKLAGDYTTLAMVLTGLGAKVEGF